MRTLYRRHKSSILFITLLLSLLTFLYASYLEVGNSFEFLKNLRNVYHSLINPIREGINSLQSDFEDRLTTREELEKIKNDLQSTQTELLKYKNIFDELHIIKKEKETLEKLLGYKQKLPQISIPAKIISKDPQNLFSTIIINKGTKDGIKEGQAVVGFRGGQFALVGKIFKAYNSTAKILTLLDQRCRFGIKISEQNSTAIMRGQTPASHYTLIEYLDKNAEDLIGNLVVTSALGGNYSENIPIGRIKTTYYKGHKLFQSAEVDLIINFFTLQNVFVYIDNDIVISKFD